MKKILKDSEISNYICQHENLSKKIAPIKTKKLKNNEKEYKIE